MKPETACEKIMNKTFIQIHLLNNSKRTVDMIDSDLLNLHMLGKEKKHKINILV